MVRLLERLTRLLLLALAVGSSAGCSIFMAATDAPAVDYDAVEIGMPREAVLERLGYPDKSFLIGSGGRLDQFEFESGRGQRALRAVAWAMADAFTLGAAELLGTPVESELRAEVLKSDAVFGADGRLRALEIRKDDGEPIVAVGDTSYLKRVQLAAAGFTPPEPASPPPPPGARPVAPEPPPP